MADLANLQPDFSEALSALIAASGGKIYVKSGYRTVERQQQLWDAALAKYGDPEIADNWVARPGQSNHNKGGAADLGGDLALAHQLAPQFGLVFPMSWENWHVELAGAQDNPDAYTTPPEGHQKPDKDSPLDMGSALSMVSRFIKNPALATARTGKPIQGVKSQTGGQGFPAAEVTGGALTKDQIRQYAEQAGFTGAALDTMVAIVMAESGGRVDAGFEHGTDTNLTEQGEKSVGLSQINYRPSRDANNPIRNPEANLDPLTNLRNAFEISGGGQNFGPWTTYNTGAYRSHL